MKAIIVAVSGSEYASGSRRSLCGNNISGNGRDYGGGGERRYDRKMIIVTAKISPLVEMGREKETEGMGMGEERLYG